MNLSVLQGGHSREDAVQGSMSMYPDFPIEQMVHGKDAMMRGRLKEELWRLQRAPTEDVLYVAATNGLRVLARTEVALQLAVATLCERFENALAVDVPSVRYIFGAQVLEPYMEVEIRGPDLHFDLAQKEIESRRGRIYGIDNSEPGRLLLAEAPLAHLLGCAAELDELTSGSVTLRMRLNRYERIDHDGPEAA